MANRYEVFKSGDGYRWRLRADNGEIVAQSESYTRQADAKRGAEDAQYAAIDAEVVVEGDV